MSELSERNTVLIAYGLYLFGLPSGGLTTLIGVILAHVRLNGARGTPYESHYRNLILVFWVWLVLVAVGGVIAFGGIIASLATWLTFSWPAFGLALIPAGLTLWLMLLCTAVVCLWYYWRLLRGLVLALDDKAF
ncbi:MAG TPA: hypothetical protein VKB67_13305 [Rhizomicrobium sp.]|nr:hypothetical protein [Rhizomicrobium sp.]